GLQWVSTAAARATGCAFGRADRQPRQDGKSAVTKPLNTPHLSTRASGWRKERPQASLGPGSVCLRLAFLHRRSRRQPAVLGHGHDVSPAARGGAGHEVDAEQRELWLALTRPDVDAAVGRLGQGGPDGDAGIAVVGW